MCNSSGLPRWCFPVVKKIPANTGDIRDMGLIPGLERFPGGGHGNPLQYSCLENPMDRGAWWATVHGVAKSKTRLKRLSTHIIVLKDCFMEKRIDVCFPPEGGLRTSRYKLTGLGGDESNVLG